MLWLILATVFAHALLPVGSPLVRTSGSAFSATTADVSLAPSRKDKAAASDEQHRSPAEDGRDDADGPDTDLVESASTGGLEAPRAEPAAAPAAPTRESASFRLYEARAPPLA
ncbi:MAG: hypothetical protein ACK40O_08650 [Allosphingosinicella sp.]